VSVYAVVASLDEIPPDAIFTHFEEACAMHLSWVQTSQDELVVVVQDAKFNLRRMELSGSQGEFRISMRRMRLKFLTFKFQVVKKTFPSFQDAGHANLDAQNIGIDIRFLHDASRATFQEPRVKCRIGKVILKFEKDVHHPALLSIFNSAITANIRSSVQDGIEKGILEACRQLMVTVQQVTETVKSTGATVPSIGELTGNLTGGSIPNISATSSSATTGGLHLHHAPTQG